MRENMDQNNSECRHFSRSERQQFFFRQLILNSLSHLEKPSGKSGRRFIDEFSRLMNEWLKNPSLKDIVLKAITIMPNLLLQKSSQKSKSKNYLSTLERRMELWESGELLKKVKRRWNNPEISKDHQYNINHQQNIEETHSQNEKR